MGTRRSLLSRRRVLALTAAAPFLPARAGAQSPVVRISTTLSESFAEPFYADDLGF